MDFGLPASCTLGGTGKGIHTEGRVQESLPSEPLEHGDSPEADKQVGNARVCASLLQRPNCYLLLSLSKQRSVVWYLTPLLASTAAC